eukprot:g5438.t1
MLEAFQTTGTAVQSRDSFRTDLTFDTFDGDFTQSQETIPSSTSKALFSFGLGTWERNVTRGRGHVVAVDCARDVVVVATSRNYVLRYNYQDLTSSFQHEVEIFRPPTDSRIQSIFLCPSTHHLLVNLKYSASGFETHYVHSSWTRSRQLSKLRGVSISDVGWCLPAPPVKEPGVEERDWRFMEDTECALASRETLIGNYGGTLYSCIVDSREKSGLTLFKRVYDFQDKDQVLEICGVAQQILRDGSIFIFIATNVALYILSGTPPLEALFAVYINQSSPLEPFWDLPVPCSGSHLSLSWGMDGWPKRFAWMVDTGVYHGSLNLANPITTEPSDLVEKVHLWGLERAEEDRKPIALATTEFHFILMFDDSFLIVNRISGKVAQSLMFTSSEKLSGKPSGIATDSISGIVYLFTSDALMDVGSRNEDKDIWKVYMDMQDFTSALSVCRTSEQRDEVYITHAEQALNSMANTKAAKLYAKLTGTSPSFEEIALKFIQLEDSDALHAFLRTKLECLGTEDRAQKTMVASWLTELYLDKINRALMEESGEEGPIYHQNVKDLRDFLVANVEDLDVSTTVGLLASYGRVDDLMHFAESRHDHEALLESLMQRGDIRRALAVMRLPSVSRELVYKFAPDLMSKAPALAVDFWISQQPSLDPRRLLPGLVSFAEEGSHPDSLNHALRFIEFSINTLQCQDSAIHNLAIELYSQDPNEEKLVAFIKKSAEEAIGALSFDGKYALRLIRERGRKRACVVMLCVLKMYEDAISLALTMDLDLAKSVASSPDLEDHGIQRKLWLAIARHVIQDELHVSSPEVSINKAVALLEEAGDLIKIEDVLPFFPDFVTIDKFQGPIRKSLEDYNKRIEMLKMQMDKATDIADALRKDLKKLESRTAIVAQEQACVRCHALLTDPPVRPSVPYGGAIPPFYVFPTGLAYHGACLIAENLELSGQLKQTKIISLITRLASVKDGEEFAPDTSGEAPVHVKTLQRQLDAEIGTECPRNGEMVVRMIEKPFISIETSAKEIHSWAIPYMQNI